MLYQLSYAGRMVERETGIEPATNRLEICDSTIELLPQVLSILPRVATPRAIPYSRVCTRKTARYDRISPPQRAHLCRARHPRLHRRLFHRHQAGPLQSVEGDRAGAQRGGGDSGRGGRARTVLDHRRHDALIFVWYARIYAVRVRQGD